jgi:hypothetical protein
MVNNGPSALALKPARVPGIYYADLIRLTCNAPLPQREVFGRLGSIG